MAGNETQYHPANIAYEHDLLRFRNAYEWDLELAISELSDQDCIVDGRWMWSVFPCLRERCEREALRFLSIDGADEARRFLDDEFLGNGIRNATRALLSTGRPVSEMFRYPGLEDQLHASLTLFSVVDGAGSVFGKALATLFDARQDMQTLTLLGQGRGDAERNRDMLP